MAIKGYLMSYRQLLGIVLACFFTANSIPAMNYEPSTMNFRPKCKNPKIFSRIQMSFRNSAELSAYLLNSLHCADNCR